MKKILFSSECFISLWANIGVLILRLSCGLMLALGHGIGKLPPSEGFIGMIETKLNFPAPLFFAWLCGLAEFFGGLFIALGVFTRITSAIVSINFLVAVLIYHLNDTFGQKELALFYLFISLTLLFTGPGRYSFDHLFKGSKQVQ